MRKLIFCFFVFLLLTSCTDNRKNSDAKENDVSKIGDRVFIYINRTKAIGADMKTDSVFVEKQAVVDTATLPQYKYTWVNLKRIKSKEIADSLYQIALDLISHPDFSDDSKVTDYAGDYLSVQIENGNTEFSFNLKSVANWSTSSDRTLKLSSFLHRNNLLE